MSHALLSSGCCGRACATNAQDQAALSLQAHLACSHQQPRTACQPLWQAPARPGRGSSKLAAGLVSSQELEADMDTAYQQALNEVWQLGKAADTRVCVH